MWVKEAVDQWVAAAKLTEGTVFRTAGEHGTIRGHGVTENIVW
jgi:hypothetical protein